MPTEQRGTAGPLALPLALFLEEVLVLLELVIALSGRYRLGLMAGGQAPGVVTMDDRLLLTIAEAAALLRIGRSTMYAMAAAGEIPTVRIGRAVRVPRAALEAWVEARTAAP